jgi:hypothetical protein
MTILFRHFWVAFIAVTLVNFAIAWRGEVARRVVEDPALAPGYRRLFRNAAVFANLPWLGMGAGIVFGDAELVHDYLAPSKGKLAVQVWWLALAVYAAVGLIWLFRGGAETLSRYHGLPGIPPLSPQRIKWIGLAVVGWNVFIGALLFAGFPGPMHASGLERVMPFGFPILFVGMWLVVCWVIAQMGWATLARHFRASVPSTAATTLTSGRINAINYNGCLRVGATDDGLKLSILLPWKLGHPDLFIPFRHIRVSTEKRWFTHFVVLDVLSEDGSSVRIAVPRSSLTRLFKDKTAPEPLRHALA